MEKIFDSLERYKYTSLQYSDPGDVANAKVYINTADNIFLYEKPDIEKPLYWNSKSKDNIQLHWASISEEKFFEGLTQTIEFIKKTEPKTEKLYLEFIPEDFLVKMHIIGFKIVSEWVDYWCDNLSLLNIESKKNITIRPLKSDEIFEAGKITRNCSGYSRWFTGESDECIKEWFESENSNLFAAETDGKLIGVCYALLYGFESKKGTVLWIRELAVDPSFHSKGIGRELLTQAIKWGLENGAKRSFLACDTENFNAIKLYESFNYRRKNERGQINMEFSLK